MANSADLGGSCFCAISGASRGIGRALAVQCAKLMGPGSTMLLMARNEADLLTTKSLAETPGVRILTEAVDLSAPNFASFDGMIDDRLSDVDLTGFDLNLIIHNVGSVGDLSLPAESSHDAAVWRDYCDLNVFGVVALNNAFLKRFRGIHEKTVVVNVTSLCAIKPFAGLAYYCSGKASREMFFKVLAEENPKLRVLNYAPGPVKTEMVADIIETASDAKLKENFTAWRREGQLLEPEQTAKKFTEVLMKGNYKSGDHVDYFD